MPRMRYTSGGKEGELLTRAKALRKDPFVLLPRLADGCPSGPFDRIRADLGVVQEAAGDSAELERLSLKGEGLARAYAGLLHYAEERPNLSALVAHYPTGDIPYLAVAKATKEELVAVQYYDDPRRLLLGYLRFAKGGLFGGGGYHFYALDRGILCTGKEADPPSEFVRAALGRLPYKLTPSGDGRTLGCPHRGSEGGARLKVRWTSVDRRLEVCARCVKDEAHLVASLSENMVIPDPEGEFTVEAGYPLRHAHAGSCGAAQLPELSARLERDYRHGKRSDRDLLNDHASEVEGELRSHRGSLLLAGGTCYGSDVDAFVADLDPTPAEKRALKAVLSARGTPFLAPEPRSGKVVELLWADHARELLEAAGAREEDLEGLEAEGKGAGRAAEILNRVSRQRKEEATLARLPSFEGLVPEAELADELARLYRVGGAPEVARFIASADPPEGKVRGITWAFLVALGQESTQSWRFSETEREFGGALAGPTRRLLEAAPPDYAEALGGLLTAAGVAAWGQVARPAAD